MAKYVIAGKADCPFYARAELLADELKLRLPEFSVHKIIVRPEEWKEWLSNICQEKGWNYDGGSPVIWRELINRGGKGTLVGSCNEFLEMAKCYYGFNRLKSTDELQLIAGENKETKQILDSQIQQRLASSKPFRITVTEATSALAYNILPHICSGNLFTEVAEISLKLCPSVDSSVQEKQLLGGLAMELQDCAQSQLKEVVAENNLQEAFTDADIVLILNTSEVLEGSHLETMKIYGMLLNTTFKESTKILVVGENSMITCYIISQFAKDIPREQFFALSRYEENKVKSAMAKKLDIITAGISSVIVWGSSDQFIVDHSNATAKGFNGAIWAPHIGRFSYSVAEMIYEQSWFSDVLPNILTQDKKGNSEIKTSLSLSAAVISQLGHLIYPNQLESFSLGLISKGWYDIPEGIVFSFPVTYCNNEIKVKSDLNLSNELQDRIKNAGINLEARCKELMQHLI